MSKKLKKFIIFFLSAVMILGVGAVCVSAKSLRERDQAARARYRAVKAQYLKEVNWWKKTRQQFLQARAKYRKFKNAENKALYEEQARAFLEKTVEVLIKKLEALKNWVANKPSLSESARSAIVAEIEEDINWLKEKKSGIATASPAQIKEKAREIREYWRKHRIFVKKIIGEIWAYRLDWAIEKFESVSSKIEAKIEELKAMGVDTANLEAWLSDFNQKIAIAKEKRDKAREKYQAISNLAEADRLFREAHQFIKEANQYLHSAHRKLVEIIKEMKRVVALSAKESAE